MTEDPARVLLWSTRALPTELRGLLIGVIAVFAVTSTALTLAAGRGWESVLFAIVASLVSVGVTVWLAWSYDTPRSRGMLTAVLLAASVLLVTSFAISAQPTTVLASGLPFAFAITWHRPAWFPLIASLTAVGAAAAVSALQSQGSLPVQDLIVMIALLGAPTVAFASAQIGWQWQRRLDQHNADQRDLALTRERLRFATDLHDIQGHTLLAIKLKAELSRRSIDHDSDLARQELHAIEDLAAEADRRTRDLAHGYRTLNLAAELANLDQLLTAAGIDVTFHRAGTPPPERDETFAALAREAASNILRHANATTARILLNETTMVIDNDGAAPGEAVATGSGNGLSGLQRRFTERDGTFTWQHEGDLFTVTGEIGLRP